MAYEIKFNGKSLNADRAVTLNSWDRSEIGMLRVVSNEIIHSMESGDYRGLKTVLLRVEGRKAVFSTIKSVIKATVGKSISVGTNEDGLTVSIKAPNKRVFEKNMAKVVKARDAGVVGLFNTDFLSSIGIGGNAGNQEFDLAKAAKSIVKRAMKADFDVEKVLQAIRVAYADANEKANDKPVFDNAEKVVALG